MSKEDFKDRYNLGQNNQNAQTTPGISLNEELIQTQLQRQKEVQKSVDEKYKNDRSKFDEKQDQYKGVRKKLDKIPGFNKIDMGMGYYRTIGRSVGGYGEAGAHLSEAMLGGYGVAATGLFKGVSNTRKLAQQERDNSVKNELGVAGKLGQANRIRSYAGRSMLAANTLGTIASGGVGNAMSSNAFSALGITNPAVLAGTIGLSLGSSILKNKKLKKITANKKSPFQEERKYALSTPMEQFVNQLVAQNELDSAQQLQTRLLMYIESHTSLVPLIHTELEYLRQEKEKGVKGTSQSYNKQILSDDSNKTSVIDKIETSLSSFITKFDPFTQLTNFLLMGKTPSQMLKEIRGDDESKKQDNKISESLGISSNEARLLQLTSQDLVSKGKSYEEKMFLLASGQFDVSRILAKETITMRKGMGIDQSAFSVNNIDAKKSIFSKALETITDIPGLSAIFNATKTMFNMPDIMFKGAKSLANWGKKKLFGEEYLRLQDNDTVKKELGLYKSKEDVWKEFVGEGLPQKLEDLRVIQVEQLEVQQNIYGVSKSSYELLYEYVTGQQAQVEYKSTQEENKQRTFWDKIEQRYLSAEATESAVKGRQEQIADVRAEALKGSLFDTAQNVKDFFGLITKGQKYSTLYERADKANEFHNKVALSNTALFDIGRNRDLIDVKNKETGLTWASQEELASIYKDKDTIQEYDQERHRKFINDELFGVKFKEGLEDFTDQALPKILQGIMVAGTGGLGGIAMSAVGGTLGFSKKLKRENERLKDDVDYIYNRDDKYKEKRIRSFDIFNDLSSSKNNIDEISNISNINDVKSTRVEKSDIVNINDSIAQIINSLDNRKYDAEQRSQSLLNIDFNIKSIIAPKIDTVIDILSNISNKITGKNKDVQSYGSVVNSYSTDKVVSNISENYLKKPEQSNIVNLFKKQKEKNQYDNVVGFATGGKVDKSKDPIIVGEKGPEIFIPDISGEVQNNNIFSSFIDTLKQYTKSTYESIFTLIKLIKKQSKDSNKDTKVVSDSITKLSEYQEEQINSFEKLEFMFSNASNSDIVSHQSEIKNSPIKENNIIPFVPKEEIQKHGMGAQLKDIEKEKQEKKESNFRDRLLKLVGVIPKDIKGLKSLYAKGKDKTSELLDNAMGKIFSLLKFILPGALFAMPFVTGGKIGTKIAAQQVHKLAIKYGSKIIKGITSIFGDNILENVSGVATKASGWIAKQLPETLTKSLKGLGTKILSSISSSIGKITGKSGGKLAAKFSGGTIAKLFSGMGSGLLKMLGLGKLFGKGIGKLAGKSLAKSGLKKIPFLGALVGVGFGVKRLMDGDVIGAAAEIASGLTSLIPGLGIPLGLAIDGWLAFRDMGKEQKDEVDPTQKPKKSIWSQFKSWIGDAFKKLILATPIVGGIIGAFMEFKQGNKDIIKAQVANDGKELSVWEKAKIWSKRIGYMAVRAIPFVGNFLANWMQSDKEPEIEETSAAKNVSSESLWSKVKTWASNKFDYIMSHIPFLGGLYNSFKDTGKIQEQIAEKEKLTGEKVSLWEKVKLYAINTFDNVMESVPWFGGIYAAIRDNVKSINADHAKDPNKSKLSLFRERATSIFKDMLVGAVRSIPFIGDPIANFVLGVKQDLEEYKASSPEKSWAQVLLSYIKDSAVNILRSVPVVGDFLANLITGGKTKQVKEQLTAQGVNLSEQDTKVLQYGPVIDWMYNASMVPNFAANQVANLFTGIKGDEYKKTRVKLASITGEPLPDYADEVEFNKDDLNKMADQGIDYSKVEATSLNADKIVKAQKIKEESSDAVYNMIKDDPEKLSKLKEQGLVEDTKMFGTHYDLTDKGKMSMMSNNLDMEQLAKLKERGLVKDTSWIGSADSPDDYKLTDAGQEHFKKNKSKYVDKVSKESSASLDSALHAPLQKQVMARKKRDMAGLMTDSVFDYIKGNKDLLPGLEEKGLVEIDSDVGYKFTRKGKQEYDTIQAQKNIGPSFSDKLSNKYNETTHSINNIAGSIKSKASNIGGKFKNVAVNSNMHNASIFPILNTKEDIGSQPMAPTDTNNESNNVGNFGNIEPLVKKHIVNNEGIRLSAYKDSKGLPTIGIGHLITENDPGLKLVTGSSNTRKLNNKQVSDLFNLDYQEHKDQASQLSVFDNVGPVQKGVLIDMTFNMGVNKVKGFKNMLSALEQGDNKQAYYELLDSQYAREVGRRARINAELLYSNNPELFRTEQPQVIARNGAWYTGADPIIDAQLHTNEVVAPIDRVGKEFFKAAMSNKDFVQKIIEVETIKKQPGVQQIVPTVSKEEYEVNTDEIIESKMETYKTQLSKDNEKHIASLNNAITSIASGITHSTSTNTVKESNKEPVSKINISSDLNDMINQLFSSCLNSYDKSFKEFPFNSNISTGFF